MSIPETAAGRRPTGLSTENLPPTSGGTLKSRYPSRRANARRAPRSGSVVTTTRRRVRRVPSRLRISLRKTRHCASVSAVPPDFVTTLTAVFLKSSRSIAPATNSGSTLSRTKTRGRLFRFSRGRRL